MLKISIITATYNSGKTVGDTLKSVLSQTYHDYELLVVDGASKDNTLEVVKKMEPLFEGRIRYVSEPDKGIYDAMNKGIDRATGDYLVFLNAGDVFPSEDTLEYVEGCVGEGEILPGVLYGDTDIVNDEGRFLRHRRLTPPKKLTWRSFKWGMLVCHQSFYARTDIAREVHYDLHYRLSADVDWCIRIMREAERRHLPLRNVNAVITNYLDGGMSVQNHKASLKERFEVMRSNYGIITTLLVHAWFVVRGIFKK